MSEKRSVIIGASIVLGCLILSLPLSHTAVGHSVVSPSASGKYQLVVRQLQAGTTGSEVYVFEPATGQCWLRHSSSGSAGWRDLGSPTIKGEQPMNKNAESKVEK